LGIGVETNVDQAIFWYEKAAEQGNEAARNRLEQLRPNPN
jgi:TPR repeat protein